MKNDIKIKILEFYNQNKTKLVAFCFGCLLLLNLVAIPIILRGIVDMLRGDRWKYLSQSSVNWYERTQEAQIFFGQQNINLLMACAIMASLLYEKHKKMAFLCLTIPAFYMIIQAIF